MTKILKRINDLPVALRAAIASVMVFLGLGVASAAAAPPTLPADPLAGGMGDAQGAAQTWVITYGVPVVVALVILGGLIRLGLKWLKRGLRAI